MNEEDKKHNLDVFQARTRKRIQAKRSTIGRTEKRKDGYLVHVTDISTARGRTYRFHEGQHVNHVPVPDNSKLKKLSYQAQQGIEDILLHTKHMPEDLPESVLRDEKATALNDLRLASYIINTIETIKKDAKGKLTPSLVKWWNQSCVISLRAKAILGKNIIKSKRKHKFKFPRKVEATLNKVVAKTQRSKAIVWAGNQFQKILLEESPEPDMSGYPLPMDGEDEQTTTFRLPFAVPFGNPKPQKSPNQPSKTQGDPGPKMPYKELKMTIRTLKVSHDRNFRFQSTGSQPDPFRLARASFSPVSNLFKVKMRKKEAGGTFLCDASGSMGINGSGLSLILEKLPSATVAYYSSDGLVVYAKGGMRSNAKSLEHDGGNDWDHQALQWLLTQKPPYFFVTDECFCCDRQLDPGQEKRAQALLHKVRPKMNMYRSYVDLVHDLHSGEIMRKIKNHGRK